MAVVTTVNYNQLQFFGESVHERLRFWRIELAKVSQAEMCSVVNHYLAEDERIAVTTVSNYERKTEPRASFLAALKQAYPALSLTWLVTGEGRPLQGAEGGGPGEGGGFELAGAEVLAAQPGMHRFRDLPPVAAHILLAFLEEVRISTGEYQGDHSRAWRDFLQRFSHLFFEPFQSPRHFAAQETMSDSELTDYTLALVCAIRPLVVSIRRG
jgi:hypothetical protein